MITLNPAAFPLKYLGDEYGRIHMRDIHIDSRREIHGAISDPSDAEEGGALFPLLRLMGHRRVSCDDLVISHGRSFCIQLDALHRKLIKREPNRIAVIRYRLYAIPINNFAEFIMFIDWLTGLVHEFVTPFIAWESLISDAVSGDTEKWRKAFFDGAKQIIQEEK